MDGTYHHRDCGKGLWDCGGTMGHICGVAHADVGDSGGLAGLMGSGLVFGELG